jgi:type I restriction enzyme S subunit
MGLAAPKIVHFTELERWDVKFFLGRIKSKYPLVPLSEFVIEHNEKIRPYEEAEKTYKILGVNNTDGIFHAYDAKGKTIKQPYKKVKAGDFAYNPYRINVGSIGWVPSEHDGAYISPAYVVFSIDESVILPELFWFILKAPFFNEALRAATAGSVRMNLTYPLLQTLKIPILPIPFQQKIVAYWEDTKFKADTYVVQAQNIIKNISSFFMKSIGLKDLKIAHNRRAFISTWQEIDRWGVGIAREMSRRPKLTDSSYPVVSLSDVIDDLQNGWSPKCLNRPAETNEWGALKLGSISFGWFDERQNKAFPKGLKPKYQYEVKKGDLIISRGNVRQYVGACALVPKVRSKLMLSDLMFRVIWKTNSLIMPEFLDEIFKTPHLRWQIENNLTGTSPTMKKISKPTILGFRFPLPPINKQNEIIDKIGLMRHEASLLQNKACKNLSNAASEVEKMILGVKSVEDI